MPSLLANVVKWGANYSINRKPEGVDALLKHLRTHMNRSPIPTFLPLGVSVRAWQFEGLQGDSVSTKKPSRAVLYLHGGGYLCGKTKTYHNFCSRLAKATNAQVILPDYRLAPENPFPAAVEDAVKAYSGLLNAGWHPSKISVAGDSAGAGLALGMLLALRDQKIPLPACAILMSPLADLRTINPSITKNDASDWMLSSYILQMQRHLYAQTPEAMMNPYASPVFGDFTGLPPFFITVCEQECLRDDAYIVADKARAAGVPVVFVSREDLLHIWPIFVPIMPEAKEDLQRMIYFIHAHCPA